MSLFRAMILDDRGKSVSLVAHYLRVRASREPEKHARLQAVSRRPPEPWTAAELSGFTKYGILWLPLFLVCMFAPVFLSSYIHAPLRFLMIAAVPLGLMPITIIILISRRAIGRRIARAHVHAGYCGSCGYDILHTQAASDGCRVCPECGSAWHTAA